MQRLILLLLIALCVAHSCNGQRMQQFADSIRKAYDIPELSYAVVSADSVYDIAATGVRKINTQLTAGLGDRFRIGSNTKAITGFIAAQAVKAGNISWGTKFFNLFPEMKAASRAEYQQLTLRDLLTFRARLFPYTYTNDKPVEDQFKGDEGQQRYEFAQWFFAHDPVTKKGPVWFSNLGYVAAALMLEKATGKPYKQLVRELGAQLNIDFRFGPPNAEDTLQTWGHNGKGVAEAPADNYKLNWLLPAGNINAPLPDYIKFIQLQLLGLQGRSLFLTKEEFYFLHFGLPRFSVGWFQENGAKGAYSWNIGNPGTFLSQVFVFNSQNRAIILFANIQSDEASEGMDVLRNALMAEYGIE